MKEDTVCLAVFIGFDSNKKSIKHNQPYASTAAFFCSTSAFLYVEDTNAHRKSTEHLTFTISLHVGLLDNLSLLKLSVPVFQAYTVLSPVCRGELLEIVYIKWMGTSPPRQHFALSLDCDTDRKGPNMSEEYTAQQRVYNPFGYVECQCTHSIQRNLQLSQKDASAPICILPV